VRLVALLLIVINQCNSVKYCSVTDLRPYIGKRDRENVENKVISKNWIENLKQSFKMIKISWLN